MVVSGEEKLNKQSCRDKNDINKGKMLKIHQLETIRVQQNEKGKKKTSENVKARKVERKK